VEITVDDPRCDAPLEVGAPPLTLGNGEVYEFLLHEQPRTGRLGKLKEQESYGK